MAGFCKDLFSVVLISGCVLNVILGVFTLTGNNVLDNFVNNVKDKGIFVSEKLRISVEFFTTAGILLILYVLLFVKNHFMSSERRPDTISYKITLDTKHSQLLGASEQKKEENIPNGLQMDLVDNYLSGDSKINELR